MQSIWTFRTISFAVGSFMPVIGLLLFIFIGHKKNAKLWTAIGTFGVAAIVLALAALNEMGSLGSDPKF